MFGASSPTRDAAYALQPPCAPDPDISTGHGCASAMARDDGVALASGARRTDKYVSAPESARALSSHALAPARFATR